MLAPANLVRWIAVELVGGATNGIHRLPMTGRRLGRTALVGESEMLLAVVPEGLTRLAANLVTSFRG